MSPQLTPIRFITHPRLVAAVRAVLIMAILVAGWRVGRSYVLLFSEWRQLGRPVTTNVPAGQLDDFPAVLPLAGPWSFADSDWNMSTESKSAAEMATAFESLASLQLSESADNRPDLDDKLADLIEKFNVTPIVKDGNQIYSLDQRDLKARLVVRNVGGRDKMIGFAVGYAQPDGSWQLAEFTPRSSTESDESATPHLLPLPVGARRIGGRYDSAGRLLMEIVEVRSSADAIISDWRSTGWEVRPSGMGGPEDFSYLCARGGELVYIWSAEPRDALENLVLVRSPAASDTKP